MSDERDDVTGAEIASGADVAYRLTARARSKRASVGIFGQLLGIVGGGIVGLALGYYVLLWIGGARVDFLEIRDQLPQWLLPREPGDTSPEGKLG